MLIKRVADYRRSRSELNGKLATLVAIQLGRPGLNNPSEATTILTQGEIYKGCNSTPHEQLRDPRESTNNGKVIIAQEKFV
jgi:hypothetical protein